MNLNDMMQIDHVIQVHEDGTVTDGPVGVYAPEVVDGELDSSEWRLLNGYSGQYGYSGPVMHSSEYIGGALERDILERPGLYAAVVSYSSDGEGGDEYDDIEGWCVAYREDAGE